MASAATNNDSAASKSLDVLVVGAGFGGLYQLHYLRKMGYKIKVVDNAGGLGGVWYWNCFPGARTDTDIPSYEYSMEGLYKDWKWSERFPSRQEVLRYFQYVDEKLDLSKDMECQTEHWRGIDVKSKKVAIVGTGASGVQCIQEIGPEAGHLTVFQRTPNLCLPMNQQKLDSDAQTEQERKAYYDWAHKYRRETFAGMHFDFSHKSGADDTAEQNKSFFEGLWSTGGFPFWLGTYKDVLFNKTVNDTAYEFWAEKTRARINDPKKKDILAPLLKNQPHTFGTKRPSLEQRYYEVYNQGNVDIIALKQNPIETFTETGIKMKNGDEHQFDIIILATGFDFVTGGLCQIDIKGTDGTLLRDKWAKGTKTYLGMATANFPNMFFLYGPQAPTAFANGPTFVELQGDWIIEAIDYCTKNNKKTIDTTAKFEAGWMKHVAELNEITLFSGTDSWYMGANIPGKPREALNYAGGIPMYFGECKKVVEKGYTGFNFDASYNTRAKA